MKKKELLSPSFLSPQKSCHIVTISAFFSPPPQKPSSCFSRLTFPVLSSSFHSFLGRSNAAKKQSSSSRKKKGGVAGATTPTVGCAEMKGWRDEIFKSTKVRGKPKSLVGKALSHFPPPPPPPHQHKSCLVCSSPKLFLIIMKERNKNVWLLSRVVSLLVRGL